jgi:L-2-amino-thiazoline-4-carboxylic acid hydrolase
MGMAEDYKTRGGLIASMLDVNSKQYLFLRNLAPPVIDRFGAHGRAVLEAGLHKLGHWRGQNMRQRAETMIDGRSALSLVRHWDAGDYAVAALSGPVSFEGSAARMTVTMPQLPGMEYFASKSGAELLEPYWRNVLQGIVEGYDDGLSVEFSELKLQEGAPWSITWSYEGGTAQGATPYPEGPPDQVFDTPVPALRLIRQSAKNNGAVYMFIAREVVQNFDTAGEEAIREGCRALGRERALAHLEKHRAKGLPLDLRTLMNNWDGPLVSIWIGRDQGFLSPGTYHWDCTYCPYADVWAEYGPEGLALGYLYDMEVHLAIFRTYNPRAVVQWEALKTRGDSQCKFRFSFPDLIEPGDPTFQPRGGRENQPGLPKVPAT